MEAVEVLSSRGYQDPPQNRPLGTEMAPLHGWLPQLPLFFTFPCCHWRLSLASFPCRIFHRLFLMFCTTVWLWALNCSREFSQSSLHLLGFVGEMMASISSPALLTLWMLPCVFSIKKYVFFSISIFFSFLKNVYWSIVDLQCCITFCCRAKWISYTYLYIYSFIDNFSHVLHYRVLGRVPCSIQ